MAVPGWRSLTTPTVDLLVPEQWETVDPRGAVLAVAEPASDEVEFRASAVVDVRRAHEPVEALVARAIREALARPGWTHVVADQPWLYADDNEGRVIEALYEDCGICVNLTRFLLSTGSLVIDLQMRASVRDRFRVESLFEMIAGSLSVQEDR